MEDYDEQVHFANYQQFCDDTTDDTTVQNEVVIAKTEDMIDSLKADVQNMKTDAIRPNIPKGFYEKVAPVMMIPDVINESQQTDAEAITSDEGLRCNLEAKTDARFSQVLPPRRLPPQAARRQQPGPHGPLPFPPVQEAYPWHQA